MTTGDSEKDRVISTATVLGDALGGLFGEAMAGVVEMLRADDTLLCMCGSLIACPVHPV